MSMINEQVKRLREKAKLFSESDFAVDGIVKDYNDAADTIEELSAKLSIVNNGWIPCSSGNIPNKDGMYLTTVFDKSTNRRMLRHRKFENGRFIEGGTSRAFPVIAWYYEPLPEPYQPKGE